MRCFSCRDEIEDDMLVLTAFIPHDTAPTPTGLAKVLCSDACLIDFAASIGADLIAEGLGPD